MKSYTKGDLKEVFNPMMDLAKGESKIIKDNNGKAKTVKGDTWYSNNAKETEVISYEPVDPNDPNYDAPDEDLDTNVTHDL